MKKIYFAAVIMMALFCFTALTSDSAWAKEQTTCPVMGGPVNKDIYIDYNGKRVYLCCKGCIEPFNKEPEKYIKKLESGGVDLPKVPAKAGTGK